MAGYTAPNDQFVNATLINTQANRQREKFKLRNNNKGAADLDILKSVFKHPHNLVGEDAEAQFSEIVNNFKAIDQDLQLEPGANPDFPQGVDLDYRSGMSAPSLDQLSDKPNELGPNVHVPNENTFSPVAPRERVEVIPNTSDGGYGFKIDRNSRSTNPSDADTLGTYFKRHYNFENTGDVAAPIKGEFVDSSYDY